MIVVHIFKKLSRDMEYILKPNQKFLEMKLQCISNISGGVNRRLHGRREE